MTRMVVLPVTVPKQVADRVHQLAPSSGEQAKLLRTFILEGLNRHELDCLWCSIKDRQLPERKDVRASAKRLRVLAASQALDGQDQ